MKPLDFYRLGLLMADSASTEAEHRNVVSRLYYGLHHEACCRYFRENPYAPVLGRGSRHTQLIRRFESIGNAVAVDVSRLLDRLFVMRNIADYELGSSLSYRNLPVDSRTLMGLAIIVARDLLDALERYSPGEAPDGCDCPTAYSVG